MKYLLYSVVAFVFIFSCKEAEVSSQSYFPYGGPMSYNSHDDDDFGLLLTVLLLATRGGGGCGGCCTNNIPIPYPIPIPTNNPIITRGYSDGGGSGKGGGGGGQPNEVVNVITSNDIEAASKSKSSGRMNSENETKADSKTQNS